MANEEGFFIKLNLKILELLLPLVEQCIATRREEMKQACNIIHAAIHAGIETGVSSFFYLLEIDNEEQVSITNCCNSLVLG